MEEGFDVAVVAVVLYYAALLLLLFTIFIRGGHLFLLPEAHPSFLRTLISRPLNAASLLFVVCAMPLLPELFHRVLHVAQHSKVERLICRRRPSISGLPWVCWSVHLRWSGGALPHAVHPSCFQLSAVRAPELVHVPIPSRVWGIRCAVSV